MDKRALFATLGNDPHTQGIFKARRIAREAGYDVCTLPPGTSEEDILRKIQEYDPTHIGLSYRLTPENGLNLYLSMLRRLASNSLLSRLNGERRSLAFAGLPETVEMVTGSDIGRRYDVRGIQQDRNPVISVERLLDYLEIYDTRRDVILESVRKRLIPSRIEILDQLATEIIEDGTKEGSLEKPSNEAMKSYTDRIFEVWPERPLLRVHYGEPGLTVDPTIEGIKKLANEGVVDEISLGSSDFSQRYFDRPEKWVGKNDGGVPYRNFDDLMELLEATRRGNYPSIRTYAHVVNLVGYAIGCIKKGILGPSHHAVPLYYFNELDGRGSTPVQESIEEHINTVQILGEYGIATEMNNPNQWQSRWAPDSTIVADYGLITSIMIANGVKDMVLQMQFNKPRETSDYGDLAKFTAALKLVNILTPPQMKDRIRILRQTRTGIGYFEPHIPIADYQLARSTLLQSMIEPHAIHIVPSCEALYAAKPDDVIKSSDLVRKAYSMYRRHKDDLRPYLKDPEVIERRDELVNESLFLLREIAKLNPRYPSYGYADEELWRYLHDARTLYRALEEGYMSAPGIFTEPYRTMSRDIYTDMIPGGFLDMVDPNTFQTISQEERLNTLKSTHNRLIG